MPIAPGSTSQSVRIFIRSAASGLAAPGLVAEDVAMSYGRPRSSAVPFALVDIEPDAEYTAGGFAEVDGLPGVYRVDVPDAALAAGADEVILYPAVGEDYLAVPLKIPLEAAIKVPDFITPMYKRIFGVA